MSSMWNALSIPLQDTLTQNLRFTVKLLQVGS